MRCPYCRCDNDRVTDTRAAEDGFATRRRRQCLSCSRRYTTYERLEEAVMRVIKKDGAREPLRREKIQNGLDRACWKRPVTDAQINDIITACESEIYADFEDEIHSRQIGEIVMRHLAEADQVAYVRFASVYREFKDAEDFVVELTPMLKRRPLK